MRNRRLRGGGGDGSARSEVSRQCGSRGRGGSILSDVTVWIAGGLTDQSKAQRDERKGHSIIQARLGGEGEFHFSLSTDFGWAGTDARRKYGICRRKDGAEQDSNAG